jgi:hypothetical protein
MMWDDDSHLLVRKGSEDWRLQYASHDDVDEMLAMVEGTFDAYPDVGHIGLSSREGNNRLGIGAPHELVAWNTRIMRVYAWDTELFLQLEHGRVQVQEDFDTALQGLSLGRQNVLLGYWASGQVGTSEPGGCSDYRTLELHNSAVLRMAELWPGIVKVREKQNKSGRELSSRLESTIMWKRAYRNAR